MKDINKIMLNPIRMRIIQQFSNGKSIAVVKMLILSLLLLLFKTEKESLRLKLSFLTIY
ncbi:MAG: hypothetical protein E6356_10100 [Terrisporobacter othiniensis]|nr:hypothetical protein [Terrisporobacter othiniensis]MDU6995196.1 hypothetical protein [Terrisporobacter othiniensis]